MTDDRLSADVIKEVVRTKYRSIADDEDSCCGGTSSCGSGAEELAVDVSDDYGDAEDIAAEANLELGCGLPTEYADLQSGERVLDLGSGAGMDAFVARRDVGPDGHVHGVDLVEEMVEKARTNADTLGYENVTFETGDIEALPVDDDAFDVILSNCVLNLVPNKERAFAEMARVIRPDGRFSVSDIVHVGMLPDGLRDAAEMYVGCVGGAMDREAYLALIRSTGFTDVRIATEKTIDVPDQLLEKHLDADAREQFREDGGQIQSITVTGRGPAR